MQNAYKKMKNILKRIDQILEQIKKQEQKSTYWYVIVLNPELSKFFNSIGSISNFFRKLTNGTINLPGSNLNNRQWWKSTGAKGYYRYEVTRKEVELTIFIETNIQISEHEFRSRTEKLIGKTPIIFGELDGNLFDEKLYDLEKIDSGVELFGDYKKEKLRTEQF